ncbi:hypothetical protein ISS05_05685 [Candidatus Woesearchaeota archaeon]|nr:hypothetical protein [Candidatus Woesearchaeota archaeon]
MKQTKLPDLDKVVLDALNLFRKSKLPKLNVKYKRPLVLGSGNAAVTGRIIFANKDAVFADEGNYKQKIKAIKNIDGAILISASGGKHAPIIAKDLKKRKIETILITNNPTAEANKFVKKTYFYPKNTEPYTYNTSTYMGMILGKTKESPQKILNLIKKIKTPRNLKKFNAFYIIVPTEFDNVRELFQTKFDELFGPKINGRVFTIEQTKHAKTVVPSDKEFFIGLGYNNKLFGKKQNRLNITLPKSAGPATVMALGYHIIGQIQKQHPNHFKNNIVNYTKQASKMFKSTIKPVVE